MACYHPITAWKSKHVNASGKRSLVFDSALGIPFSKLQIPCGHCIGCRIDRSAMWATRMVHEQKYSPCSCFLTCTYSNEFLPEHGQLVPKHIKAFVKALNDKFGPELRAQFGRGVRYVLCGEYGDELGRPHYHIALYGVDFSGDRKYYKKSGSGDDLFMSETATRLWGRGDVYIGSLTPQSAGYIARYVMKKVNGDRAVERYSRVDPVTGEWYMLTPEFIRMSNRPGIGRDFFDDPANGNMYERGGFPLRNKHGAVRMMSIPKYYDMCLERVDPEKLARVKSKRVAQAKKRKADCTPERLAVREEVCAAKVRQLKREL
ncbi:hypothetical protein D3C77_253140 [compost metagenome]